MRIAKRKDGIYATADRSAWLKRTDVGGDTWTLYIGNETEFEYYFCDSVSEAQNTLDLYLGIRDLLAPDGPEAVYRGWTVETRVGPLRVSIVDDWIACRFEDVARVRASNLLSRFEWNDYSGKWNHGCGQELKAADMLRVFRREFARVAKPRENCVRCGGDYGNCACGPVDDGEHNGEPANDNAEPANGCPRDRDTDDACAYCHARPGERCRNGEV